jgi:hypothetical protein
MTAIRNFPNAPVRQRTATPIQWRTPAFVTWIWHALHRYGQRRAAWELDALAGRWALSDPALARQFRATAAQCRRAGMAPQVHQTLERNAS